MVHTMSLSIYSHSRYEEDYLGWGPKYFFGRGWDIPAGVLISGIVLNIRILGIRMNYVCKGCKQERSNLEENGVCTECQEEEKVMDFLLT